MKKTKGKCAAIFDNFLKNCGSKKAGQEQVTMMEPITKLPLFQPQDIKKASLDYYVEHKSFSQRV